MLFVLDQESQMFQSFPEESVLKSVQAGIKAVLEESMIGWGCFETLYWNGFWLEGLSEHMRLLARSIEVLGMIGAPDPDRLGRAVSGVFQVDMQVPARVRVTISAEFSGRVCGCMLSVLPCPDARTDKPLSLAVSSIRRNQTSPLSQIKSVNYGDNLLARKQAQEQGADEALILNMRGCVAGLAMGNLLVIKAGNPPFVCTPPPEEGIRVGYMRKNALKAAQNLGWKTLEIPIVPEDLLQMQAVLACNSLWGIRPATQLDGGALPENSELMEALRQECLAICKIRASCV